jgi:hypothetical protein
LLVGKNGLNFMKSMFTNMDMKALKKQMGELLTKNKLTKAEAETLIKASIEYETKEAMVASLKTIRADLVKQMTEILKMGGKAALQSSSQVAKQSLKDMFKASFTKSLSGFKQAMLAVMGETGTEYVNNLFGNFVDNLIKGAIKEAINGPSEGIPFGVTPQQGKASARLPKLIMSGGKWGSRTVTITFWNVGSMAGVKYGLATIAQTGASLPGFPDESNKATFSGGPNGVLTISGFKVQLVGGKYFEWTHPYDKSKLRIPVQTSGMFSGW